MRRYSSPLIWDGRSGSMIHRDIDVYKRQIEGRGQFVGVTLATGLNGNNTCWVEGEARMYLDDDP